MHGGGYTKNDKFDNREQSIARDLVSSGYAVMTINYQLCKGKSTEDTCFPDNIIQTKTAIRYLKHHSSKFGIDKSKIAVFGTSVGGNLAALAGYTSSKDGFDSANYAQETSEVKCVIDFYGPVNMMNHRDYSFFPKRADDATKYKKYSASTYAHAGAPPTLIVHGDADTVVKVQQSKDFKALLESKGVSVKLHIVSGGKHSFHLTDSGEDLRSLVTKFLDSHLKNKK